MLVIDLWIKILPFVLFKLALGCLRPEDVSDDEKLSRAIKIIAVSKFIKEIVRMAANLNLSLIHI